MKSEYGDRDTIGSQLLATEKEHQKTSPISAGELSEEMGKGIMARILDVVEQFQGTVDKLYIETIIQRDPIFKNRKFTLIPKVSRTLPLMQPNQDVWFVDYVNEKFEHLWGLPSRSEFELVLCNESPDNAKNIEWINAYLKLERKAKRKIQVVS
jgi:hypothetical protein